MGSAHAGLYYNITEPSKLKKITSKQVSLSFKLGWTSLQLLTESEASCLKVFSCQKSEGPVFVSHSLLPGFSPPGTENCYCETSLKEKQPRPAFFYTSVISFSEIAFVPLVWHFSDIMERGVSWISLFRADLGLLPSRAEHGAFILIAAWWYSVVHFWSTQIMAAPLFELNKDYSGILITGGKSQKENLYAPTWSGWPIGLHVVNTRLITQKAW